MRVAHLSLIVSSGRCGRCQVWVATEDRPPPDPAYIIVGKRWGNIRDPFQKPSSFCVFFFFLCRHQSRENICENRSVSFPEKLKCQRWWRRRWRKRRRRRRWKRRTNNFQQLLHTMFSVQRGYMRKKPLIFHIFDCVYDKNRRLARISTFVANLNAPFICFCQLSRIAQKNNHLGLDVSASGLPGLVSAVCGSSRTTSVAPPAAAPSGWALTLLASRGAPDPPGRPGRRPPGRSWRATSLFVAPPTTKKKAN